MDGPRIGALFAGYGGLDLAVKTVLGGELSWYSEIDRGALKILRHRFPHVPNIGDITAADWSAVEPVDILTGGFPCQDISTAGKRAGIRPGTRSGLWAQFAYAITQLNPRTVVIENVRGLLSAKAHSNLEPCPWCMGDTTDGALRALGAILGDLAGIGYDAQWHGLRAADVGACHPRFRVFLVAHPTGDAGRIKHGDGTAPALPPDLGHERDGRTRDGRPGPADRDSGPIRWGDYGPAITRWATVIGRQAPEPRQPPLRTGGEPQLAPRFVEWMLGLPAGWVTDVPGITRNEALRALGNGVCPQQATAALRHMTRTEAPA